MNESLKSNNSLNETLFDNYNKHYLKVSHKKTNKTVETIETTEILETIVSNNFSPKALKTLNKIIVKQSNNHNLLNNKENLRYNDLNISINRIEMNQIESNISYEKYESNYSMKSLNNSFISMKNENNSMIQMNVIGDSIDSDSIFADLELQ